MWNDIAEISQKKLDLSYLNQIERKMRLMHAAYDEDYFGRYLVHSDVRHIKASLETEGTSVSFDDTRAIYEHVMPENMEYLAFMECNNLCVAAKMAKEKALSGIPLTYDGLMSLYLAIASNLLNQKNAGHIRTRMVEIGRGNYRVAVINQIEFGEQETG